jgi:hypothetical protein
MSKKNKSCVKGNNLWENYYENIEKWKKENLPRNI